MFCENCGNKIEKDHKFCVKCGYSAVNEEEKKNLEQPKINQVFINEKWWHRLFRVIYIILYVPLLLIVPAAWSVNKSTYTGYNSLFDRAMYKDTYGKAFWYSLLTLIIYLVVVRIIKIIFIYIAYGNKPKWRKEFKKLY